MKLQIDTDQKTIKLDEEIALKELLDFLNQLFKDKSWEEFKLVPNKIELWKDPIIITHPIYPIYPLCPQLPYNNPGIPEYPNWPTITYEGKTAKISYIDHQVTFNSSGIFNFEII